MRRTSILAEYKRLVVKISGGDLGINCEACSKYIINSKVITEGGIQK